MRRRIAGQAASFILASAALMGFSSAQADTTLTYTGPDGQYKVYMTAEAIRIDGDDQQWQLYRKSDPAIVSVDPKQQTVTRLDQRAAVDIRQEMDNLRARVETRLGKLPPAQREAAKAAMSARIPGLDKKSETVGLDHTGRKDSVAGVSCEVIQIVRGGQPADQMCVASRSALDISKSSFATLQSMFKLLQSMLKGTGLEGIGLPYQNLSGMPVRFLDSVSQEQRTLVSVSHQSIAASRFDIPKSYVEQRPSALKK